MKQFIKVLLVLVVFVSLISPVSVMAIEDDNNSYGTTYYLDSQIGKENGDGLSQDNAFDSLDDINERVFQPGDKILIKAGSKFTGTLWPKGSGAEGYPIIIDMYGQGAKPKIDGDGAYFMPQQKNWQGPFTGEDGDQIGAAVYLYNQEYIEINNLAVSNQGDNQNRDRSGIRIEGYDYGVINHIYIRNCDVRDVRGYNGQDDIYSVVPTDEDGKPIFGYEDEGSENPNTTNNFWGARTTHRTGGINLSTYTARLPEEKNAHNVPVQKLDETKKITIFNDVLIENNTIENCQANGITTTNVKGSLDDDAFRHTNVIIRDNYIHNVTRAGIIPLYTSGVLVEFNKVDTFQSTLEGYGCGIWSDRANDMVFQYNEICNGQNGNDGMAFNLDDMTRNGVIQYNYTHDNYGGGYMLHVRQNSYNRNNVIRYNLSVNDSGTYAAHNAQIVAVGENETTKIENAQVYNNTFISNKDCHAVYRGDEVFYNNNIWYFTNKTVSSRQNCFEPGANSTFNNNAYIGCIAPEDSNKYTDNPQFVGKDALFGLSKPQALRSTSLLSTSPYLNKAIEIENNGGKDIMGRPIGVSSNLGAINGPGHIITNELKSVTINANDELLKRYLSNGTLQTEVINETATEATEKWVNTTYDGTPSSEPVIYTKKQGNYIEFSFNGTGGTMALKHGAGAGQVEVKIYRKNDLENAVKTISINTYNSEAEMFSHSMADLSETNEEYVVRVYNNENGKATNFSSFVTDVKTTGTSTPGCDNDQIAGLVLPRLPNITIPYGQTMASAVLNAHVFMDTCNNEETDIEITYMVNNDGQIDGNKLIVNKAGTYQITAHASYSGVDVTDIQTIKVIQGKEPQINIPPVNTQKLKSLVNGCNTLILDEYFEENKETFKTKLATATDLLLDKDITQQLIDTMVTELQDAKDRLIRKHFDAEATSVIKTGNWVEIIAETLHKGSALKSGVADEKLSLTFNGNSITVYGRKAVGTGTTRFVVTKLDDGQETQIISTDVDCYQSEMEDQQALFTWTGKNNGDYRLDVINTGVKNSSATNPDSNTIIDYLKINRQELDKKELEIAVEKAEKITENELTNVIPLAVKEFKEALQDARDVLNDAKTTQAKINSTLERLTKAMDKLSVLKGDKTELLELIEKINKLNSDDYTSDSWNDMQTVLKEAKALIENENATVEEVNKMYNSLTKAYKDLIEEVGQVDKKKLEELIKKAEMLKEDDYTSDSWINMQTVLKEAKALIENENATLEEVNKMYNSLTKAYKDLKEQVGQVDKESLEELIKKAEMLKENDYTSATWKTMQTALKKAKEVYANKEASEAEINEAEKGLEAAIEDLAKKTIQEEPIKPNESSDDKVETSDNTFITTLAIAMLLSTSIMQLLKIRKKI